MWVKELQAEIQKYAPDYLELLSHPKMLIRAGAASLMRELPEPDRAVVPGIIAALHDETEPTVRIQLWQWLGSMDRANQKGIFTDALPRERRPLSRAALLVECAQAHGSETPPEVLEEMETVFSRADVHFLHSYYAAAEADLLSQFALTLRGCRPERADALLLAYLAHVTGSRILPVPRALGLLSIALIREGKMVDHRSWSPEQRKAVAVVAKCAWWTDRETCCNMVDVLEMFELPNTRKKMETFLGESIDLLAK